MNGTVNPGDADTYYQFEYGKTTSYGQSVPAEAKNAGKGLTNVKVAETISGLVFATTYHFRLKATDGTTTSYGADKTFTTTAPPPHWFACTSQSGGKYTSNKCSTEGAPNTWESVMLKEGEKTSVTAKGETISLTAFPGGVKSTLKCETEVTSASLESPSGGGNGTAAAQLKFKGCIGELGWGSCKITPSTATAVKAELSSFEGKAYPLITAKEGTNMASFVIAECVLAGTYELTGTLRGLYSNANSKIEFSSETEGNLLKLKLNGVSLKTTPTGSIGLETSAGGYVKGRIVRPLAMGWVMPMGAAGFEPATSRV